MRDYLLTIETLYRLDLDERQWLREVARSARPWLDAGLGVMAWPYEVPRGRPPRFHEPVMVGGPERFLAVPAKTVEASPEETSRTFWAEMCSTASQQFSETVLAQFPAESPDFMAILGTSGDGVGVLLGAPLPEVGSIPPKRRRSLQRLATHMAASYRLRKAVDAAVSEPSETDRAEAVLQPDGRCVHAQGAARSTQARDWLRRAARAVDEARSTLRNEDPAEALALWRGLVAGRWSLVDQFDRDGRRHLVAIRNDADMRDPRALTLRERQVAACAGLGRSNALIAYELGLSQSTVAQHLRRAIRKLGVRNRTELVRMLAPGSPQQTEGS